MGIRKEGIQDGLFLYFTAQEAARAFVKRAFVSQPGTNPGRPAKPLLSRGNQGNPPLCLFLVRGSAAAPGGIYRTASVWGRGGGRRGGEEEETWVQYFNAY